VVLFEMCLLGDSGLLIPKWAVLGRVGEVRWGFSSGLVQWGTSGVGGWEGVGAVVRGGVRWGVVCGVVRWWRLVMVLEIARGPFGGCVGWWGGCECGCCCVGGVCVGWWEGWGVFSRTGYRKVVDRILRGARKGGWRRQWGMSRRCLWEPIDSVRFSILLFFCWLGDPSYFSGLNFGRVGPAICFAGCFLSIIVNNPSWAFRSIGWGFQVWMNMQPNGRDRRWRLKCEVCDWSGALVVCTNVGGGA